jgi:hypothetical protein
MSDDHLLAIYLNDHLAAATAGVALFRRVSRSGTDVKTVAELTSLTDEVVSDRDALRQLMRRLSVMERRPMEALGWFGEKLGRLKLNGRLLSRSPLSDVIEMEGLRLSVQSKLGCWRVLRALADHDPRLATQELDTLVRRAEDQARRIDVLHHQAAEQRLALSGGR